MRLRWGSAVVLGLAVIALPANAAGPVADGEREGR